MVDGCCRWRLVSAPSIPGLLSLDPIGDPTSLLSSLTMGTEVEVQFGKSLQVDWPACAVSLYTSCYQAVWFTNDGRYTTCCRVPACNNTFRHFRHCAASCNYWCSPDLEQVATHQGKLASKTLMVPHYCVAAIVLRVYLWSTWSYRGSC